MRRLFVGLALLWAASVAGAFACAPGRLTLLAPFGPLVALGVWDVLQTRHTIRRNFPVIGHGRYLLEMVRPEINQYFVESNTDGKPFSREERSVVYQRAKGVLDTVPFGTQWDLGQPGAEWMNHSLAPVAIEEEPRITVGEATCARPYRASLLNVAAMSYGALGDTAIRALNLGAAAGGFAQNTGEGGISDHHRQGGDLIWQIGTGYFGCRTERGLFDPERFRDAAALEAVRMIEIKLSQGAKPGHGGILPAAKLTPEIVRIRGVAPGRDVVSPPAHTAFSNPIELVELVAELRELSGGKPVGLKLCVGKRRELLAVVKAMLETGLHPDYIAVDGAEGGTGAAPLEFSNSLGHPLVEGLVFVHNALRGARLRDRVKLFASGKIVTGFDMARVIALGADACYSARAMMLALGCIQARRCNSNDCPAGVATQARSLTAGLVVKDKAPRVARYHRETVRSFLDLLGSGGLRHPAQLRPWHIVRRTGFGATRNYGELFDVLEEGALLRPTVPERYERAWAMADPRSFESAAEHYSRELAAG